MPARMKSLGAVSLVALLSVAVWHPPLLVTSAPLFPPVMLAVLVGFTSRYSSAHPRSLIASATAVTTVLLTVTVIIERDRWERVDTLVLVYAIVVAEVAALTAIAAWMGTKARLGRVTGR